MIIGKNDGAQAKPTRTFFYIILNTTSLSRFNRAKKGKDMSARVIQAIFVGLTVAGLFFDRAYPYLVRW